MKPHTSMTTSTVACVRVLTADITIASVLSLLSIKLLSNNSGLPSLPVFRVDYPFVITSTRLPVFKHFYQILGIPIKKNCCILPVNIIKVNTVYFHPAAVVGGPRLGWLSETKDYPNLKHFWRSAPLSHLLIGMGTEQLNSCVNTDCFIQQLA